MAGRYDEARPATMHTFKSLCRNTRVVIIEDAGHGTIFDKPEENIRTVRNFLLEVGKTNFSEKQ